MNFCEQQSIGYSEICQLIDVWKSLKRWKVELKYIKCIKFPGLQAWTRLETVFSSVINQVLMKPCLFHTLKLDRWWNKQLILTKITTDNYLLPAIGKNIVYHQVPGWFSGQTPTSALRSERILTTHLLTAIWKVKLMTPRIFSNASSQRLLRVWQQTGSRW